MYESQLFLTKSQRSKIWLVKWEPWNQGQKMPNIAWYEVRMQDKNNDNEACINSYLIGLASAGCAPTSTTVSNPTSFSASCMALAKRTYDLLLIYTLKKE